MNQTTTNAPPPWGMHPESVRSGRNLIRCVDQQGAAALLGYCPINRTGAVYSIVLGRWHVVTPIGFDQFAALAAEWGVSLQPGPEFDIWCAACSASVAADTEKH